MADDDVLEMDRLSLIDVSSEDDSLLFSSFLDPSRGEFPEADMDDKVLGFFGYTHDQGEDIPVSSLEEKEEVLQPFESPELEKMTKRGKYNLRKSLAWDNAFFTSAGVLEPEELSSMMENNHINEKQTLSAIQEDVNRSTESISTLQSDCTVGDGHEFNLFEDIRASIQRSAASDKKELGGTDVAIISTSNIVDPVSHNKVKLKARASEKLSIRAQGLEKATNQPVAAKGLSTSISKPPKGINGVRPMSMGSTKRTSLDVNKIKQEKDSKFMTGKGSIGLKTSISGSGRTIPPRPLVPAKASLGSLVTSKNELTSSCSSLDSCASASSSTSHKYSLDSIKKKNSNSPSANHSLANRNIARAASRNITQLRNPALSTNTRSKAKPSSSISPATSISDLSSESSQASTPSKMARGGQKASTPQTLKPRNSSSDESLVAYDSKVNGLLHERGKRFSASSGVVVNPASGKPTGLRMPSPNIGFFDGVRSVAQTSTRNTQPRPGMLNGLTSSKSGKLQLVRPPLQESSNLSENDKGSYGRQSPALAKSQGNLKAFFDSNTILPMEVAEVGKMLDMTLNNQIDKPTKQNRDMDSDNNRSEVEKDFTRALLPHVSEVKTMSFTVNRSGDPEEGAIRVPTVSAMVADAAEPMQLASLENIPAGYT